MPTVSHRAWLEIEQIGPATVAKFNTRYIVGEEKLQSLGKQLLKLAEEVGRQPLILDFSRVERFSTEMFGKLLGLQRRVQARGGKLILCGINPELFRIFLLVHLAPQFMVCDTEQEALQELHRTEQPTAKTGVHTTPFYRATRLPS